ncbi:MAG: bifunctional proline dehydrogenase/L-glutamate gamma-semialdehyde dehydrogenase, partial [Oceanospirillales bacterium]|nr:bifunctional proline dehydrogenase/L-glutamate gamma-semialdehyde dehydrogenase [Oceanospirillales bacterium]
MALAQSTTPTIHECRQAIHNYYLADEYTVISELIAGADLSQAIRDAISVRAAELVRNVRANSKPTMMEKFLAQYGLSTKEGVALMCLAEALLRVPDNITIHELIEDKVSSGKWADHRGKSKSSLINTTTWGLMVAGKLISPADKQSLMETLRSLVKRMGDPMVRTVAHQAMKEMGRQFVLGRTIEEALKRAEKYESKGYTYSYDMLGEAARTDKDALRYHRDYSNAISELKANCKHADIRSNPGISVKLSALHPRYEFGQRERVMNELV